MFRYTLFFAVLIVVSCKKETAKKTVVENETNSPNIILIYTDDQGIGDVGYNGNPYINTPNLDKLANNGVIFENFYTAPVCSPSRSSLLTGKNFIRTGIFDTFNGGSIMATEEVTMAELLKDHGYLTGIFGKWHLGDLYPFRPQDQGFDETFIHKGGGVGQPGDPDNYHAKDSSYFSPIIQKNGTPVITEGYCADVFTNGLLDFVKEEKEQPFFAYLAFNTPHDPFQVPQEFYDKYADLGEKLQAEDKPEFKAEGMSENILERTKRIYGMIENIDYNLGRLLGVLEEDEELDNTIILFISDNGPLPGRYQMGLRGAKSTVYEAGIKVPAIMYHSKLKPQRISETLSHIDIMPTLLEYCGLDDTTKDIDGISFAPILQGDSIPSSFQERTLYYHWQRGYPEAYRNIAVRKGDYKLIANVGSDAKVGDFELFNINEDPFEKDNLNTQLPEKVAELRQSFDDWLKTNLSQNKNYEYQRFIIGSEHERVSVLSRNDARSMPAMWTNDRQYGLWDIAIAQTGTYKLTINYREPLPSKGVLITRMAPFQKTVNVDEVGLKEVVINDFYVEAGNYRLESMFRTQNWQHIAPFTITIEKQ